MDEIAISNDPTIVQLINDYGFPIVLAVGMGYFIYMFGNLFPMN